MTRDQVYNICKDIAGKYAFDPILILALCEQESSYDETAMRLEQGFYQRYVKPQELASSVKAIFSTSWGLTQVMGQSLHEMQFFQPTADKTVWPNLYVAHQIDQFMVQPRLQVEYGCRWLKHKQTLGGKVSDIETALRRYNGSADYPPLVFARRDKLRQLYK